MDFTHAYVEFMDNLTAGRIIIGDEGTEPPLGVIALKSACIEVGPVNQRLNPFPVLQLKRLARRRI